MRRHGWSCQVPVRQAMCGTDDAAVAVWKAEVWPDITRYKRPACDLGAWICFECAARRCHFRMGVKDRHFFAVVAAE